MTLDQVWLPEGHIWDIHFEKHSIASDLSFTGGGNKLCWHTTETPWDWWSAGVEYFTGSARGKAPHFLVGGRAGALHPYVAQFVPLDESSFALQNNTADGFDTNRANVIQVEICGYADSMGDFSHYRALANLFTLIDHRRHIENWTHADAGSTPQRFSDYTWVMKQGHVGHNMAPDNDHYDPGKNFRWGTLQDLISTIPDGGYNL